VDRVVFVLVNVAFLSLVLGLCLAFARLLKENRAELRRLVFSWPYILFLTLFGSYVYGQRQSAEAAVLLLGIPVVTAYWLLLKTRFASPERAEEESRKRRSTPWAMTDTNPATLFQSRRRHLIRWALIPACVSLVAAGLVYPLQGSKLEIVVTVSASAIWLAATSLFFFLYRCPACGAIPSTSVSLALDPPACRRCGAPLRPM
jgi:hypothetical protein